MIYKSLTDLIGHTRDGAGNYQKQYRLSSKILAKLESFNPAGSIKDRVAKEMMRTSRTIRSFKPRFRHYRTDQRQYGHRHCSRCIC